MSNLIQTYLQYGIPSHLALKYTSLGLSVTTFRSLPIQKLVEIYGISDEEASQVKKGLLRQPIDETTLQDLLENSNFVCCCCKGIKGDSYIIHHIVEYEVSQDNSYANLAVLCPNDHDLAHRPPGLTNRLTTEQIRKSKESWETKVKLHNLAVSKKGERDAFLLKLPRYQELEEEIVSLRSQLADKEKLLTRSEALFDLELAKLKARITDLEAQKELLEQQVIHISQEVSKVDLDKSSEIYSRAVSHLANADIAGAIEVLREEELDGALNELEKIDDEINRSIQQNADSRLLKAQLFVLERSFSEAHKNAGQALQLYEKLVDRNPDYYLSQLAYCFENVGTIYYNTEEIEASEACFLKGLQICDELQGAGNFSCLPLVALLLQNLGASYYARDDYEKAKQCLEEALSLSSQLLNVFIKFDDLDYRGFELRNAMIMTNLGNTYSALGMAKEAEGLLLQSHIIHEDLTEVLDNQQVYAAANNLASLGQYYMQTKNLDAAKDTFLQLLSMIRNSTAHHKHHILDLADTLLNLCSIFFQQDKGTEALKYCDEAISLYRNATPSESSDVQLAAALLYKSILFLSDKKLAQDIILMLEEAKALSVKYQNNTEAQKHYHSAETLLIQINHKSVS